MLTKCYRLEVIRVSESIYSAFGFNFARISLLRVDMKTTRTLIAAFALILPLLAAAQTNSTTRIDQRQLNQESRIQQGIQSGSLTQKEAANLEKGQTHVQNMENKALSDGKISQKEASHINQAQDKQSRKIEHQKHDKQHDYDHDGKKDKHNKGKKPH